MWFKNLSLFRFADSSPLAALSPERLHEELAKAPFRPCGPLEMGTLGWVPPLGKHGTMLTHAAGGRIMVCARSEDKLLPATVVKEVVAEKVAELEEEQMRKLGRKERERIKDDVLHDLLPRAFTRSRPTFAYLDPPGGWLLVDTNSRKRAEDLTGLLRRCLGPLELDLPLVNENPTRVMTRWLQGEDLPAGFLVEQQCELREPSEEGSQVRLARQDLAAEEVRAHLEAGKQVFKLALTWDERLSFVLDSQLLLRRLRFLDVVQEEAADTAGDGDEATRFDADFALMALELARLLPALMEAFGGEAREQTAAASPADQAVPEP